MARRPGRQGGLVRIPVRRRIQLSQERAMAMLYPLGVGGGARGVDQQRDGRSISRSDGFDRRVVRQLAPGDRASGGVANHHMLEIRQATPKLGHAVDIVGSPPVIGRDQNLGARLPQNVFNLRAPIDVNNRQDHRAGEGDRGMGDDGLEPIRRLHGDHVPRRDADPLQAAGDPLGDLENLGETRRGGAMIRRDRNLGRRTRLGRCGERLGQGHVCRQPLVRPTRAQLGRRLIGHQRSSRCRTPASLRLRSS